MLEPSSQQRQDNARGILPVTVVEARRSPEQRKSSVAAPSSGAIHIEFPGRALVSVEGRVETALVRAVLESLRG